MSYETPRPDTITIITKISRVIGRDYWCERCQHECNFALNSPPNVPRRGVNEIDFISSVNGKADTTWLCDDCLDFDDPQIVLAIMKGAK